MIDRWFNKDIGKIYEKHKVAVVIDESKEGNFLLESIEDGIQIFRTANELEELKAKYDIEKSTDPKSQYLIYTSTPKSSLKFVREYCETNGCIEIKYLDHYIKTKVNQHLNLNISLPKVELISAAKVSIGKDQTYWMDLSHKGSSEIFDMEKELLPFLDNPKVFVKRYDASTLEVFFKKVAELIDQEYVKKPPVTIAEEVTKFMLDGLYQNNINPILLSVYKNWLDSISYKSSFQTYLSKYKFASKSNVFDIHPSHPFKQIDEKWLKEVVLRINDSNAFGTILPKINQRNSDKIARGLGIHFWKDIKTLLEFDEKNISQIGNFTEAVDYYKKHFYKVDQAIRKLYTSFLTQKEIIEPLQGFYKNLTILFLDKWFKYIDSYESNQTGAIQKILDLHSDKTAIVVGDGISWEFAKSILDTLGSTDYAFEENFILAGLPSETEHNMSQLYLSSGEVVATKKQRENHITKTNSDKEIDFIDLESVNETTDKSKYLICSYKDPDKLGETYQQNALKYFDDVARTYAAKIEQLLRNGYQQVYLVTDHGFTLTGILENSDKIEIEFSGSVDKSERFIRSKNHQNFDPNLLIEKQLKYKEYEYCYFAKRLGPFKTPGVYGYSHGGLSPQETIIPFFKWTKGIHQETLLDVRISNKADLSEVTGNLFTIKIKGSASDDGLFSSKRKVILYFFADGKKINESDVFTVEKNQSLNKEYQFGGNTSIEIKVLDAITLEQLEKVSVNQSTARDLGGLL